MPVVLGLASSHAPCMFAPSEEWPRIHKALTAGVPQPPKVKEETPEVLKDYERRIKIGFETIKKRLDSAKIDVLILVGDDQTELFNSSNVPALGIFIGEAATGTTSISWIGEKPEDNHVTLKNNQEIARLILEELLERDFDPSYSEVLQPLGKPAAGIGHAFSRVVRSIGLIERNIPTVPIFLNGYHPPMPTGRRCYQLGVALREILKDRPERIAVFASGGMSHCPQGPRAGWVDEPLDRWILKQIETGQTQKLQNLFTVDSDAMRSGTGELRAWITLAGVFEGLKGEIIDYLPVAHAVTGLAFVSWQRQ